MKKIGLRRRINRQQSRRRRKLGSARVRGPRLSKSRIRQCVSKCHSRIAKRKKYRLLRLQQWLSLRNWILFHHMPKVFPEAHWFKKEWKKWVSVPVRSQGCWGNCCTIAILDTIWARINVSDEKKFGKNSNKSKKLFSPQHVIDFIPKYYTEGLSVGNVVAFIRNEGVCYESIYPYVGFRASRKTRPIPSGPRVFVDNFNLIWRKESVCAKELLENVKTALEGGPLCGLLYVTDSFKKLRVANALEMYSHPGEGFEEVNLHAVLVLSYDDASNSFFIRNSWGEDWGLSGHALVHRDVIESIYLPTNPRIVDTSFV